jgi:hypothetical protein
VLRVMSSMLYSMQMLVLLCFLLLSAQCSALRLNGVNEALPSAVRALSLTGRTLRSIRSSTVGTVGASLLAASFLVGPFSPLGLDAASAVDMSAVEGGKLFSANCAGCHLGGGNLLSASQTLQKDSLLRNNVLDQVLYTKIPIKPTYYILKYLLNPTDTDRDPSQSGQGAHACLRGLHLPCGQRHACQTDRRTGHRCVGVRTAAGRGGVGGPCGDEDGEELRRVPWLLAT